MKYLILILCLLSSTLGNAQDTVESETAQANLFRDYILKNKAYSLAISDYQKKLFKKTFPNCESDDDIDIKRLKPQVIIPATFSIIDDRDDDKVTINGDVENYHAAYGQWIERAFIQACEQRTIINILSNAYHYDAVPEILPLLNGQTKITPIDQRQIMLDLKSFLEKSADCPGTPFVQNTYFLRNREGNNANNGWFESWDVTACQKNINLNIAVLPDPQTQYRYVFRINAPQQS